MLIHVVADYGVNDLAFAEVGNRLKRLIPEAEIVPTAVPPFSTIAAGFCVAQLGLNDPPPGTVIFENVAPRLDDGGPRAKGDGEPLAFASLPYGVKVIGVLAGHAFSFFKEQGIQIRLVDVAASGSQFRSRDIFPEAVARIVRDQPDAVGRVVAPSEIPDMPTRVISYVDGFGNIKTTWRAGTVPGRPGDLIRVRIRDRVFSAVLAIGQNFDVRHGELGLTPGSSGWRDRDGTPFRFVEVFLRGGSAWEMFGHPPVGAEVEIESRLDPSMRGRITNPRGFLVPTPR